MYHKKHFVWRYKLFFMLYSLFSLSGCGNHASENTSPPPSHTEQTTIRPNTPTIYQPEASGESILGTSTSLWIDTSHVDQGYVMARYLGDAAKANIQITGSDGISYKYFLTASEVYTPLPLTSGNGTYQIDGYENVVDNKYTILFKESVNVELENEFLPFLYPNQYVNFDANSEAVTVASSIVENVESDLDAVANIYHYVVEHIQYDETKAEQITLGYLPNIDETLHTQTGICFDYAALTTAMLRSQNIPTRLEIGYSGDVYHAWISVYIKEVGWIDNIIEFSGDSWTRMDPTFASSNHNNKKILEYIGDGSNYTVQYIR